MSLDASAAEALARDFAKSAAGIVAAVEKVVSKGALNVKTDAARRISGHPRSVHYPRSISYDLEVAGTQVCAEIGPDKDRTQGALGNILEYGTSNNAPIPHLNPALDAEEPKFIAAMEVVAAARMPK